MHTGRWSLVNWVAWSAYEILYKSSSGSRGGPRGPWPPPGPVKIGHKKDGHQRRPHRFHVSCCPLGWHWPWWWSVYQGDTPTITIITRAKLALKSLLFHTFPFKSSILTKKTFNYVRTLRTIPFMLQNCIDFL